MNLKDTYNKIAEDWINDHLHDDWWSEGMEKYVSLFAPNSLILDVGCAGGLKSEIFVKRGLRVVGFDISDKMIELARQRVPQGQFYVEAAENADRIPG